MNASNDTKPPSLKPAFHIDRRTIVLGLVILAAASGIGVLAAIHFPTAPGRLQRGSTGELEYANFLYSFRYPNDFSVYTAGVVSEHRINGAGRDMYGWSQISFQTSRSNANISISSVPNFKHWTTSEALAEQKAILQTAVIRPDDSLQEIRTPAGTGLQLFLPDYDAGEHFRTGTNKVVIPTQNYIFELTLMWYDEAGNATSNADQRTFAAILQSFRPKQ